MQSDPTQNASAAAPAGEALHGSEDKYRDLFESLNDAVFLADADTGIVLDANRQAEALLGRPRDEIIGVHQTELHPPGKGDEYRERFRAHVTAGHLADYDGEVVRKDGTVVPVSIAASPLTLGGQHLILGLFRDITERKRAEEALRQSKEFAENLIGAMKDGFSVLNDMGIHLRANPALCHMTGFTREELLGVGPPHPYWPEEEYEVLKRALRDALAGRCTDFELTFKRKNGERFPVIVSPALLTDESGNAIGCFATVKDITQRKRTEEALRQSEERFRSLTASSPVGVFQADRQGTGMYVNKKLCEFTGLSLEEHRDGRWSRAIHPDDRDHVFSQWRRAVEGEQDFDVEFRLVSPDGIVTWVSSRAARLTDDSNETTGFIGTLTDITERKRAEEALRESEKKYRDVVEMARDGIAIAQDGLVKYVNPRVTEMTGYSSDELIGTPFANYVHPDDLAETIQSYERRLAGEEMPPVYEIRVRDRSGKYLHAEISGRTVLYEGRPADLALVRDITERKRADEALKRSEREKVAVLDSMSEVVVYQSTDMTIRWVNQAAAESVSMAPEQMVGHRCYEIWQKRQEPCADCRVWKALQTGRCHEGDMTTPDGRIWHVRAYPVTDANGSIEGVVEVAQDVTERKRAHEALRQSEDKYRSIVETTYDWVWEVDREGRHTYSNRSVEAILGYRVEEYLDLDAFGLMHEEDRALVAEKLPQLAAQKRGWTDWVIRWRHKDGTYRLLESNAVPVLDADGELIGFRGTDRDITERKRAEEELRNSEEKHRVLVESAEDVIFSIDGRGTFVSANTVGARALGMTVGQIVGKQMHELFPKEIADTQMQQVSEVFRTGRPTAPHETITQTKDGRRWFSTSLSPVKDASGEVVLVVGISRDVTERKRAEQERRELEAQVQHAQKLESLGVLAGGIAHDFNNLLAGVLGNADLALLDLPEDSPARTCLEEIKAAGVRASDLTRQMLAYSGRGQFAIKALDLNRQVNDMAHLLCASISKKVTIAFDLADEPGAIEADAAQIQQVVMNLITNASDAIGDRAGAITLRTRVVHADRAFLSRGLAGDELPEGCYALLEVTDTGPGMDAETRAKVFDPFFTTKFAGRGLGLAAVLGIVRGHGGTIMIESEPGAGTTVTILFPCSARPVESARHAVPTAPRQGTGTILVVDDEPLVSGVATRILEHAGFAVLTANEASEGVELFRAHAGEVDAVLLDMTMPEMSGAEVYHELRRTDPRVPVILTSGYNEQDAIGHFATDELAGFVHKPFEVDTLVAAVRQALER